ncbi:MAG: hypothetical protein HWN69_10235, partial [Desulfobacterales bacterium]|nr:hypothetical protein [Desulfobacterales bacterium]
MQKPETKGKPPAPPAAPLGTQVKVILIAALVIGGVGFAFGAVSLGLFLGGQPNYYGGDTYNYNNYTTYNTYYNTTYIYNNATGQRSIYNCCLFQVDALPGEQNFNFIGDVENESYYFNLSLKYRTIVEFFQLKSLAQSEIDNVRGGYNISIGGISSSYTSYHIQQNLNPN